MLVKRFYNLYKSQKSIICTISIANIVMLFAIAYQLFYPLNSIGGIDSLGIDNNALTRAAGRLPSKEVISSIVYRNGFFAPANTGNNQYTLDKQISSILQNYEVKYITTLSGKPYVYIKGKNDNSTRKMTVGENNGVFTILNISPSAVEIDIMGQKAILNK